MHLISRFSFVDFSNIVPSEQKRYVGVEQNNFGCIYYMGKLCGLSGLSLEDMKMAFLGFFSKASNQQQLLDSEISATTSISHLILSNIKKIKPLSNSKSLFGVG